MIEWRRVLSLAVRPSAPSASNWPTERLVEKASGFRPERGASRTRVTRRPAFWTISTEFLVEAEPDECTRFGGA